MFMYNSSVHSATSETPFFLMHGFNPWMPADLLVELLVEDGPKDPAEYAKLLMHRMKNAFVKRYNNCQKQVWEQCLNEGKVVHSFQEGDLVWLYTYAQKVGYFNKFKKP